MNYLFFSLAIILIFLVLTCIFVYIIIRNVIKLNNQYYTFAKQYNYQFDKAQGTDGYRDYSTYKVKRIIDLQVVDNPYVNKYANFRTYPFGRGADKKVAYVISGKYKDRFFQAFTYHFTGSSLEHSEIGGIFSVVMINATQPKLTLPSNVFFEQGFLCEYEKGNLKVDTVHMRIDSLMKYIGEK